MSINGSLATKDALVAAAATANATNSLFSIEVIDYYLQDDQSYYQNHIFILQIFLEQNEILLYRSYAAFCELDTKLRRQYPRSSIPALPLAGLTAFQKKNGKRFSILKGSGPTNSANGANNSATATANMAPNATALDVRESIISVANAADKGKAASAAIQRVLTKRIDNQELISNRKLYLSRYLNDLLKIPEVVMSDTFHIFLDEESPMDNQPSHIPEYNEDNFQGLEINLLLQEELPTTKTISKEFFLPMSVYQGGVVVWSFETKQHDIGFSIAFDGKEIVAYQRVLSHTKPIQGYFEVPKTGQMLFLWDNSYSKWRNKQMSYVVRIVDKETFREILDQATSMVREKLQKHKQRNLLKKNLGKIAHDTMFAVGSNDDLQQRMQLQREQQQHEGQHDQQGTEGLESIPEENDNNDQKDHSNNSYNNSETLSTATSLTDITAFYPPPSHPPPANSSSSTIATTSHNNNPPRMRNSLYYSNSSANSETLDAHDVFDSNTSPTSAGLNFRSPSLLPSVADHEITIKVLTQQLDTLKSEKIFLQHALSHAETALVQERSALASNFQQVEDMTMGKEMMEEELVTLQEENEQLRKELHDLVAQQQEKKWFTSSASSKLLEKLTTSNTNNASNPEEGQNNDQNSSNNTEDSDMMHFSEQEQDMMRTFLQMSIEEFLLHYQHNSNNSNNHNMADNIRQLLALHHFPALVTFARSLLVTNKQQQEQVASLEQQYLKQKTLSKQLKTAALQLKEQQQQAQALLQQAEHEKSLVISENETLSAKLRSYENQLRLLNKEVKEVHEAYHSLYYHHYPHGDHHQNPNSAMITTNNNNANNASNNNSNGSSNNVVQRHIVEKEERTDIQSTPADTANDDNSCEDENGNNSTNDTKSETDKIPAPSPTDIAERLKLLTQKNAQKKQQMMRNNSNNKNVVASHHSNAIRDTTTNDNSEPIAKSETAFAHPDTFRYYTAPTDNTSSSSTFPTPVQLAAHHQHHTQQVQQQQQLSLTHPHHTVNDDDDHAQQNKKKGDDDQQQGMTEEEERLLLEQQYYPQNHNNNSNNNKNQEKIIVHDFAKAEPDEISAYLSQMTSSFMSMLAGDEDNYEDSSEYTHDNASDGNNNYSPKYNNSSKEPPDNNNSQSTHHSTQAFSPLTRRFSGGLLSGSSSSNNNNAGNTTNNGNSSNNINNSGNSNNSPSTSFLSSLKQMSFGF